MTSTDAAAAPASRIFCCSSGVLIETDITPACPREDRVASHAPEGQNSLFSKGRYGIKRALQRRSEEHTSELQSLMRISYAVFCLQTQKTIIIYIRSMYH